METKFFRASLSQLKPNPDNPRSINKKQLEALKTSISNNPKFLELSPIVINEDFIVIGGNMRFKALKELGFEETPCIQIFGLTKEKEEEFIIKDNINYGDWDWNVLIDSWQISQLSDMGLNVPKLFIDTDSEVRDEDVDTSKDAFLKWVNNDEKQIKLFFDIETYERVIKFFEDNGGDKSDLIKKLLNKYFEAHNLIKDRR